MSALPVRYQWRMLRSLHFLQSVEFLEALGLMKGSLPDQPLSVRNLLQGLNHCTVCHRRYNTGIKRVIMPSKLPVDSTLLGWG